MHLLHTCSSFSRFLSSSSSLERESRSYSTLTPTLPRSAKQKKTFHYKLTASLWQKTNKTKKTFFLLADLVNKVNKLLWGRQMAFSVWEEHPCPGLKVLAKICWQISVENFVLCHRLNCLFLWVFLTGLCSCWHIPCYFWDICKIHTFQLRLSDLVRASC